MGRWRARLIPIRRRRVVWGASCAAAMGLGVCTPRLAFGAGAVRDLPGAVYPGSTITVTIQLTPPTGAAIAAAEDAPPVGWTVSNISDGGAFDVPTGKVKWGLFFAPSIPASLTYDVLIPLSPGAGCFVGTVTFDGGSFPVSGEVCTVGVPAATAWGVTVLALLILVAGDLMLRSRAAASAKLAGQSSLGADYAGNALLSMRSSLHWCRTCSPRAVKSMCERV